VVGTGRGAAGRSISSKEYTVTSADGTEIAVTLYTPATTDPAPAVLLTHGWGGFRTDPITTALALLRKPSTARGGCDGYRSLTSFASR